MEYRQILALSKFSDPKISLNHSLTLTDSCFSRRFGDRILISGMVTVREGYGR